jgi:hypothetical protein
MTFTATLHKHLAALKAKDLDSFLETIPATGKLTLIFPGGRMIETAEEFIAFHREWFADPDWSTELTIVNTLEGSDLSLALVLLDYRDVDRSGNPIHQRQYVNLVFSKKDGAWLLAHDQNTCIE